MTTKKKDIKVRVVRMQIFGDSDYFQEMPKKETLTLEHTVTEGVFKMKHSQIFLVLSESKKVLTGGQPALPLKYKIIRWY